jgi:putative membrane protein insertion efficiency factor
MSPLVRLLALLVRAYQLVLRPILPPACKFVPSCSDYAIEALRTHGALKGVGLAGWRILRCNPFTAGGYDPVPERHTTEGTDHAAFHGVGCSHPDIS